MLQPSAISRSTHKLPLTCLLNDCPAGVYYVPTYTEDGSCSATEHVHLAALGPLRVWVLWPQLQEAPSWLRTRFNLVNDCQVKVSSCRSA
jgi:hypothetical protein